MVIVEILDTSPLEKLLFKVVLMQEFKELLYGEFEILRMLSSIYM